MPTADNDPLDQAVLFEEALNQIMASAIPSDKLNLSGMSIDFDCYLEMRCPTLATITLTSQPDRPGHLVAECVAHPTAKPSVVAAEIQTAWLTGLRYGYREAHRLRQTPTMVVLDFATQTSDDGTGIYVAGSIVVQWP